MPDYDYKQIAKTPEYLKNYSKVFPSGMDVGKPLSGWSCSCCGTPVTDTSGVFYPTYAKCINCAYEEESNEPTKRKNEL